MPFVAGAVDARQRDRGQHRREPPEPFADKRAAPKFEFFALYGTAAVYYWVICLVLSFGQGRIERRLERYVAR